MLEAAKLNVFKLRAEDVHDLDGLRTIGDLLADGL